MFCVSKSKLLTFLGNEFVELLTSFCSDKNISTVFHRTKVDIQSLLYIPSVLHSSCTIATSIYKDCDTTLLTQKVHDHQKSLSHDHSMKLTFDVDKFVTLHLSGGNVCKLALSVNKHKGRSGSVKETSFAEHIKHLRVHI